MADESYEVVIADAYEVPYWDTSATGSGIASVPGNYLSCATGTTSGSTAVVHHGNKTRYFGARGGADYDKWFEVLFVASLKYKTTNGRCYLRMHSQSSYGDMTGSSKGIGFKIAGDALYGEAHNGTTRSEVNLNTTLPAENKPHRLSWRFTSGVKIEWFVDGVSKGQLTSNLPSGTQLLGMDVVLYVGNGADSASQRLYLTRMVFRREW